MLNIAEFRKYLKIDKNQLDDELMNQPQLFEKVGDAWVDAIAKRDAMKESLANIDAALDSAVRQQFDDDGEKYTEAMVKNAVQLDIKHKTAAIAFLKMKSDADALWILKESFQQRMTVLEYMCRLYLGSYFQQDSVRAVPADVQYDIRRRRMAEARSKL
jgi:hypothetical protein